MRRPSVQGECALRGPLAGGPTWAHVLHAKGEVPEHSRHSCKGRQRQRPHAQRSRTWGPPCITAPQAALT